MADATVNLQDRFLEQVGESNIPVTVYLVNGVQLKGWIRGFDNFTVILESNGTEQMIYKHALSTIAPSEPLPESLLESAVGSNTIDTDSWS